MSNLSNIKIIDVNLKSRFKSGKRKFYLAQMDLKQENSSKTKIELSDETKIKGILDILGNENESFILVFPEISISSGYIGEFIDHIKFKFPVNTVIIFGMKILPLAEFLAISDSLGAKTKKTKDLFENQPKGKPVNPCFIVEKYKKNKVEVYTQLKLYPSKFESNKKENQTILPGRNILYFYNNEISFVVLLCSDFFSRPEGEELKIIDIIDYEIIKNGKRKGLDFLINLQYNPQPDDDLFIHSLNRIYDDGRWRHKNLNVIFLNANLLEKRLGGLSKILVHKNQIFKIDDDLPVKRIAAPVYGYEFPQKEILAVFTFPRPLESRQPRTEPEPFHLQAYQQMNGSWLESENSFSEWKYIAPQEVQNYYDTESCEKIAARFSDSGKFQEAIYWGNTAAKQYEKKKDYYNFARVKLFVGIQYRHIGNLKEYLTTISQAEIRIYEFWKKNPGSLEPALILWRIKAGRIMAQDNFEKAAFQDVKMQMESMLLEIKNFIKVNKKKISKYSQDSLKRYMLHGKRQIAEMLRMMAEYEKAYNMFKETEKKYCYVFSDEKAHCFLGMGDCLRGMGDFKKALNYYDLAEEFATMGPNIRFGVKVLKGKIEIYRVKGELGLAKECLLEIKQKLSKTDYLFAGIYYELLNSAYCLDIYDGKGALEGFLRVKTLAEKVNVGLELLHSLLGIGESYRQLGKTTLSKQYFKRALEGYLERNCLWGVFRAQKALEMKYTMTDIKYPVWELQMFSAGGRCKNLFFNLP